MLATNYTEVRENLKKYCDAANYDGETIIVTRKNNENVVIMSEKGYNNLLENLFVRANKANYEKLLDSIEQVKSGKIKSVDFSELRGMEL